MSHVWHAHFLSSNTLSHYFTTLLLQICTNNMLCNLSYNTITQVMDSWEELRKIKRYEEVAGSKLFQTFFVRCPQAKVLFGLAYDADMTSEDVLNSKPFLMHASYLIEMFDTALNMLGPDMDLPSAVMADLGAKHVRYGVKSHMFEVMGSCLVLMLIDILGVKVMTPKVQQAWKETYGALSGDMISAQKALSASN
ncbi:hypothetical protein MPSEU_000874700 [Mayamaea pseudoterrestris]|nr:hypothetical protein MPSEU_000874700 [Mayamaea pseudoterrestris]